jgi:hypothetical protein
MTVLTAITCSQCNAEIELIHALTRWSD